MHFYKSISLSLILSAALITGCEDDDPSNTLPELIDVPETYSFENVSYTGQTDRQNQMEEMTTYVKSANVEGVVLDLEVLTAMWKNTGDNANGNFNFSSTKQLKDKCFAPDQPLIESYLRMAVNASESTEFGSNGVAGRITSADGSEARLYDENGWEHAQLIEKTIMGAVFYYQAVTIYMGSEKMDVDNETVVPGEGTEMQHHWDETYGYLGATNDFPEDTENVRFWANYCNGRDPIIESNEKLSGALRTGRAAIDIDDLEIRDQAITVAREEWEKVVAATAIHYLNDGIQNLADDYERNHDLSEAYAFIHSLMYNEEKSITNAEIEEVKALMGENFYEVTAEGLTAARDKLAVIFGMEDVKTLL